MTREEQLKFCKVCKNQKFDITQGIICGLTNMSADFEVICDNYSEDEELKTKVQYQVAENEILNKTASQGKRFANFLLDMVFNYLFSLIFFIFLGIVLSVVSPDTLSYFKEDHFLINYLLAIISGMIYYSTLEFTTGRTIAKFITRTKVVNENGERPDYRTILIRSLCRFIPFEPFSFLGSDNSGWHDDFSKTKVVEI